MTNRETCNIVVVGYPKSGTTWACRLISELLQCPFNGNWGFENKADYYLVEGENRTADFACYKAHHSYDQLASCWDLNPDKVVYVIRDPRDIIVSGTYFFDSFFTKRLGLNTLKKYLLKTRIGKNYLQNRMTKAILSGDQNLNEWLKRPWVEHLNDYKRRTDVLLIKYEDLLSDGITTCKQILTFLGYEISDEKISESINKQSFEKRKAQALRSANGIDLKLLRSGKEGGWHNELSKTCLREIEEQIGFALAQNNYT